MLVSNICMGERQLVGKKNNPKPGQVQDVSDEIKTSFGDNTAAA